MADIEERVTELERRVNAMAAVLGFYAGTAEDTARQLARWARKYRLETRKALEAIGDGDDRG